MGSGRRRIPKEIQELKGTRQDKVHKHAVQPRGSLRQAPNWMTKEQAALWNHAIENSPAGMLRILDAKLLAVWVVAVGNHEQAAIAMGKSEKEGGGLLVRTPNTKELVQSPHLAVINRQAEIIMRATSELGFSPTSRARLVEGGGKKDKNQFSGHAKKRA